MILSIEQHVNFIHDLIIHKKNNKYLQVNANRNKQDEWVNHNNEVANAHYIHWLILGITATILLENQEILCLMWAE